jgi:hypothetical protein
MRGRVVAQILLTLLAAGCGSSTPQEYASPEGKYRVLFSGSPKLQDKTVPTALGPITARIAITEDWSRTARMVMYADYPAHLVQIDNRDAMLEAACQGMANESKLTALSKVTIALNGHPGREVSFESQPGRPGPKIAGRARIYLVGNRLYQVFIAGRSGQLEPETIQGFFDSFALLDQGPGMGGSSVAVSPSPAGPAPVDRPGLASKQRIRPGRGPNARVQPAPTPAPGPGAMLGFYNIPEPVSTPIEADISSREQTPVNLPAGSDLMGLGGTPEPGDTAGGASIRTFQWIDENSDVVGGYGDAARSDGTKDQHFRLELDLPANTLIESIVVTSGGFHRWVTQPSERYWPIAIFQRGRPVARSHVAQVGVYSGPQAFDLYFNTGIGLGPGTPFDLEIVLSIGGGRVTLTSHCKRPERGPRPLADARPSPPANGAPSPLLMPATPGPGPSALGPGPAATREPEPQPRPEDRPAPSDDQTTTAVPTLLRASSGGATIVSFAWNDRDDDVVGSDGRRIAPGGGKDEHYRLVMDLPATAIIEEITITGGGGLRWTTKPSARFWPVAVLANQELKNRGQSLRVGAFSGRWTFDLYAESEGSIRPDHVFGVEVVVFIRGTRHHLTARCRRG